MIAKDGLGTIFLFATLLAAALLAVYLIEPPVWLSASVITVFSFLLLFMLYFFRDPERVTPDGENLIISPADGKVVQIREEREEEYLNDDVIRISIFLSPVNVHVNRIPVSGKLEYLKYYPGKYLMAWEDHASEENERAHFGVRHHSGNKMLFKQITGFLARRIVYHLSEGELVKAGERFGIMKFGSRMDLLFPKDTFELYVKEGDKTVAGESVIGELKG